MSEDPDRSFFPREGRLQVFIDALVMGTVCLVLAQTAPDTLRGLLLITLPLTFVSGVGWGLALLCALIWNEHRRRRQRRQHPEG